MSGGGWGGREREKGASRMTSGLRAWAGGGAIYHVMNVRMGSEFGFNFVASISNQLDM